MKTHVTAAYYEGAGRWSVSVRRGEKVFIKSYEAEFMRRYKKSVLEDIAYDLAENCGQYAGNKFLKIAAALKEADSGLKEPEEDLTIELPRIIVRVSKKYTRKTVGVYMYTPFCRPIAKIPATRRWSEEYGGYVPYEPKNPKPKVRVFWYGAGRKFIAGFGRNWGQAAKIAARKLEKLYRSNIFTVNVEITSGESQVPEPV